jgi:SAM-dependent methyltransferase
MKNQFDKDYFYGKKKSNYSNYEKINFDMQFKHIIRFVKKRKVSGKFLDAGCAMGFLTSIMLPYFKEVHGCDISSFAIKKAKKLYPNVRFKIVNIEKSLPYRDNFFDCIVASDVLEHTNSLEFSLKNIISKLKKDGYLIISLPINNKFTKFFKFLDKDKTHIYFPTEIELLKLLYKLNMRIVEKQYFSPFPYFYKIYGIPAEIELYLKR